MKASELRIGNFVFKSILTKISRVKIGDEIYKISSLNIHHLESFPKSNIFSPIPLTEEWLLKLGFYICLPNSKYTKFTRTNHKSRVKNWVVKTYNFSSHKGLQNNIDTFFWDKLEIKYVHQLQNLYFILNGQELEIE